MESAEHWVVLARILRPQGRKGEVLADLDTDFPERFDSHPQVWLAAAGFAESAAASRSAPPVQAEVLAHWLPVGKNAGRIVLHFAGIDSIEQAETLAGKEVVVPLEDRLPLEAEASYISDLLGCTVYDHGQPIGIVEDVQFPATPDGLRRLEEAAPLLVLDAHGAEVLVPFAKAYAKAIYMDLPEGLADLNRPASGN
jgi:16S rRNA processing protein RimM